MLPALEVGLGGTWRTRGVPSRTKFFSGWGRRIGLLAIQSV